VRTTETRSSESLTGCHRLPAAQDEVSRFVFFYFPLWVAWGVNFGLYLAVHIRIRALLSMVLPPRPRPGPGPPVLPDGPAQRDLPDQGQHVSVVRRLMFIPLILVVLRVSEAGGGGGTTVVTHRAVARLHQPSVRLLHGLWRLRTQVRAAPRSRALAQRGARSRVLDVLQAMGDPGQVRVRWACAPCVRSQCAGRPGLRRRCAVRRHERQDHAALVSAHVRPCTRGRGRRHARRTRRPPPLRAHSLSARARAPRIRQAPRTSPSTRTRERAGGKESGRRVRAAGREV
jgi:hypothetical protein